MRWQTCDCPCCPTERVRGPGRLPKFHHWLWQHRSKGTQMSVPAWCPQSQGIGQGRTAEIASAMEISSCQRIKWQWQMIRKLPEQSKSVLIAVKSNKWLNFISQLFRLLRKLLPGEVNSDGKASRLMSFYLGPSPPSSWALSHPSCVEHLWETDKL